jgi:biopolymer transport protein ExbB/TolQ
MNSPLVLPIVLVIAGVLAFMATTGILPATLFRMWPILFVILGIVGLLSLSSEELESQPKKSAKKTKSAAKKTTSKSSSASKSTKTKKKSASKSSKSKRSTKKSK